MVWGFCSLPANVVEIRDNTRKYASLTRTSRATTWREIADLVEKGALRPSEKGGRSSAYEVLW